MKLHERINCILLGTLWLVAIMLVLDFWLNITYNFNIFSTTHWQYVANLQASNRPIATGFYISITLAISMGILGLYMLFRPKFRKIILPTPQESPQPIPENTELPEKTVMTTPQEPKQIYTKETSLIQRPPRLHIQMQPHNITPKKTIKSDTNNTNQKPRYTHEIREIFEKNNYMVLTPKKISNVTLSLVALGSNETLWLGACNISHEQMADIMLAFKSVFQETLEDIEIDVNAFIINPTDNESVDSILDFNSLDELSNAIKDYPNTPESETAQDAENIKAFAGYIETVLTYLGNK